LHSTNIALKSRLRETIAAKYQKRYQKAGKLDKDYEYIVCAMLLKDSDGSTNALDVLDKGVRAFPDSAHLSRLRAASLIQKKDHAEAIVELTRLLEHCSNRDQLDVLARIQNRVGSALYYQPPFFGKLVSDEQKDLLVRAFTFIERSHSVGHHAIALPAGAECLREIAQAYHELGKNRDARKVLQALHPRSVKEFSDRAPLAKLYHEWGDDETALRLLESMYAHHTFLRQQLPPFLKKGIWGYELGHFPEDLGDLLSRLYEKKKDFVKAYDVLRSGEKEFHRSEEEENINEYYSFISKYGITDKNREIVIRERHASIEDYSPWTPKMGLCSDVSASSP